MLIGIIANPVSAKDVRRLTGLARVIDIEEKANLVARLLVGIGSVPGVVVMAPDDAAGLMKRAVALAGGAGAPVGLLDIEMRGDESDTHRAAAALRLMDARALVTVGGDGTVRAAAEAWPNVDLVPIGAGTNNAFAILDEPTVVGMAVAGALEACLDVFVPTTAVEVETESSRSLAVIDAVVVRDRWVGAGAIWDPSRLVEGFVTISRRTSVGVASISGALGPLPTGHARHIRFGGEEHVRAVFGPGLVLDVPVEGFDDLPEGAEIALNEAAGLVALDGERRHPASGAVVRVVPGPRVLDLSRVR